MFNALESFSTVGAGRAGAQLITVLTVLSLWFAHVVLAAPDAHRSGAPGTRAVQLAQAPALDMPIPETTAEAAPKRPPTPRFPVPPSR